MNYLSLFVPFAYLGILLTSLFTFSSLYRKRKAQKSHSLSPYFPAHTPRDIYLSLLHLQDHDPNAGKVPDSLLRAALLARCTENIHRIIHVRTRKNALNSLLKSGSVGEEIWQRLLRAEQELELEVKDCVAEANAFSPNWGATIFQSANEMANNDMFKKRLEGVFKTLPEEKVAWDVKRELMREGFMKELEGGGGSGGEANVAETRREGLAKGSSDEDAVMVEKGGDTGALAAAGGGGGSGGGGGKSKNKKKGKR